MVRVEETPTGDASGTEYSCATTDRKRLIDLPEVSGNDDPILLAAPPPLPRAGLMKFDDPTGRCSHGEKTQEPLQLMVHAQTDPAGQFSATSDCYPVGPVGLDARGGPVGPDVYFTNTFTDACNSNTS